MILMDFPYRSDAATPDPMDLYCFAQATAMAAMPFFNTFNPEGENTLDAVARRIIDLARGAIRQLLRHPEEPYIAVSSGYIRVEASRPHPEDGGRLELSAHLDLGCAKWWDVAEMVEPTAMVEPVAKAA